MSKYQPREGLTTDERQIHIETIVGTLYERLYGNGQPGDIETMKSRITRIEQWMWRCIGAAGALLFAIERWGGK